MKKRMMQSAMAAAIVITIAGASIPGAAIGATASGSLSRTTTGVKR
jgi:hypothetical protein